MILYHNHHNNQEPFETSEICFNVACSTKKRQCLCVSQLQTSRRFSFDFLVLLAQNTHQVLGHEVRLLRRTVVPFQIFHGNTEQAFYKYVHLLYQEFGFLTEQDTLRIPSTKKRCFIGRSRTYSQTEQAAQEVYNKAFVATRLDDRPTAASFVVRQAIEPLRNCSQKLLVVFRVVRRNLVGFFMIIRTVVRWLVLIVHLFTKSCSQS